MIGVRFSPCELRISIAGMDNIKGINSLIKPIKKKRILLNFPKKNRKISSRKNNLKKQYIKKNWNALKNLIEYQAGVKGISHTIEIREFGPGPRSIWTPKGRKNTIIIDEIPIRIEESNEFFFIIIIWSLINPLLNIDFWAITLFITCNLELYMQLTLVFILIFLG